MNNSKIALDNVNVFFEETVDMTPSLRQREQDIVAIIEALQAVKGSEFWKTLQNKVFNGILEALQRRIRSEKNPTEIYRLQGQIVWAEKYTDLNKLLQAYQNELQQIRKQYENNRTSGG